MPQKVKWGILGVANIAVRKVIPGMQKSEWAEVAGIASRDGKKAQTAARTLSIPKSFGSYEDLLADPEIEAVYNPLPNDLHVPWTLKALAAGKHVLCEKPLSLNAAEAAPLVAARDKAGVKCGEAFMVRTHPQWLRAREIVRSGRIGELRAALGAFSYFNRDAANIRNHLESGGGAMLDIGCYPINVTRFIFGEEPARVMGLVERDPQMRIDRLCSAILDYPSGQAVFTCGTQMVPYQRMHFLGTKGRVEIEIPFNAPRERACRIFVDGTGDIFGGGVSIESFPVCDQYTLQADAFSRAIRENTELPVPLEDGILNMRVIDAVFRSAQTAQWEKP